MNDCAPPPSSLSPGGVRIAALLLVALVERAGPEQRRELREEALGARGDLRVGRVGVAVDQERGRLLLVISRGILLFF